MDEIRVSGDDVRYDRSLDTIGLLEGTTDKTSLVQDYLRHYERIFSEIRNDPIQLLEIGISTGTSLKTWARFFPHATIIGVDDNEACRSFTAERVIVEIGSQTDLEFLGNLARKYQPNVIIDDGSHQAADMILTFDRLFPFLTPAGFYIIEDVHLHYGERAPQWHARGGMTAIEYFLAIASRVSAEHVEPDCDTTTRYMYKNVDEIEFIRGSIAVRKTPKVDNAKAIARLWSIAESANHSVTWHELALFLIRRNEFGRAEIAAERAVNLNPNSAHCLSRLAWLKAHFGKLQEAVDALRGAVRRMPNEPNFQRELTALELRLSKAT